MRLGEEFQEDLATFLKHHPNLLWLHELFLRQFSSASETLHALSLSKEDSSVSDTHEIDAGGSKSRLTLADRRRFLNLAKISAIAGTVSTWKIPAYMHTITSAVYFKLCESRPRPSSSGKE